jgi:predicted HicB family RNase H-like nuclease
LHGTIPGIARPRYTTQLTFRLAPSLRDDLEREAQAKGDDLGELVRDILTDHAARRFVERARPEGQR